MQGIHSFCGTEGAPLNSYIISYSLNLSLFSFRTPRQMKEVCAPVSLSALGGALHMARTDTAEASDVPIAAMLC